MALISKELLSEILEDENITNVGKNPDDRSMLHYTYSTHNGQYFDSDIDSINIHELAHKCKEWAWKRGYLFQVRTGDTLSCVDIFNRDTNRYDIEKQTSENTEPEAIFKACEYILKEMK